jgi:hypothetical protein
LLVKNGVTREPKAFTCIGTFAARAASARPAASNPPSFARWRYSFGDSSASDQRPAVIARGFPDSVPA